VFSRSVLVLYLYLINLCYAYFKTASFSYKWNTFWLICSKESKGFPFLSQNQFITSKNKMLNIAVIVENITNHNILTLTPLLKPKFPRPPLEIYVLALDSHTNVADINRMRGTPLIPYYKLVRMCFIYMRNLGFSRGVNVKMLWLVIFSTITAMFNILFLLVINWFWERKKTLS
jgi:hypothetical protein